MRIKFEKGMTPEIIADAFINFVRENDLVIGSVNMYIQTYDKDMKVEKFNRNDVVICEPTEETRKMYQEELVTTRRKRMKAV